MLPSHQQYHGLLLGQLHLAALPPLQCLAWPECTYPLNRQGSDAQHGCSSHPQHQPGVGEHKIDGRPDAIVIFLAFALTRACHCAPEDEGRTQLSPPVTLRTRPPPPSRFGPVQGTRVPANQIPDSSAPRSRARREVACPRCTWMQAEEMVMLVMGKPPHPSTEITESAKLMVNPFLY